VLIIMRAAYAYNWFDVGPAFPGIGTTFGVGPSGWGLLLAAFLAGAGVFQVPAGLLGRRYGNRVVSLVGAALLGGFGVLTGIAPSFLALLLLRAAAGAGAGLFFSPAISLVASLYPHGRRGLAVGGFSSAFSAGAAAGVVVTAVLAPSIGWRASLVLGGVLLCVLTISGVLAVPRVPTAPPPAPSPLPRLPRVTALRYPGVWAIGFAFIGMEGASFATGQFIVPYGEALRAWSSATAGLVGMMFVLPSVIGGPLGGLVAERRPNHRTQLIAATCLGAGAVALIPFAGLAGAFLIGSAFSFSYGVVYAVMYVLPHYWRRLPPEEVPLAIGTFNAIQLAGGASVSYVFGRVVDLASYGTAWELLAALQVATLIALVALPPSDGPRGEVGPPAAGGSDRA
jgi:predicted MFS family arabinose efflux permease